jgi:uncharacterized protein (TIGR04551 family)
MASVTRIDPPVALRERIDRGDIVTNYGLQVVYRQQGNYMVRPEAQTQMAAPNGPQPQTPTEVQPEPNFGAWSVTPDVWFKLHYKALTIEFEGVGIYGKIAQAGHAGRDSHRQADAVQLGWVVASELRLYPGCAVRRAWKRAARQAIRPKNAGQYLNYRGGSCSSRRATTPSSDFHFSPDYHVDEILFRHIIGTVTNAIYIKPQTAYWFDLGRTRALGLNGSSPLQHGAGPGVDARQRADDGPRDGRGRRLSQHRRRLLRRVHLGRPLAARRAEPPVAAVDDRRGRVRRADPPHLPRREVLATYFL